MSTSTRWSSDRSKALLVEATQRTAESLSGDWKATSHDNPLGNSQGSDRSSASRGAARRDQQQQQQQQQQLKQAHPRFGFQ
jgi:hypothetical protein